MYPPANTAHLLIEFPIIYYTGYRLHAIAVIRSTFPLIELFVFKTVRYSIVFARPLFSFSAVVIVHFSFLQGKKLATFLRVPNELDSSDSVRETRDQYSRYESCLTRVKVPFGLASSPAVSHGSTLRFRSNRPL